jgi:hypothetical protein
VSVAHVPAGRDRLAELEAVIERGLATFTEVGEALLELRDRRIYLATHTSFEAYCRERWDLGRSRSYQLIDAGKVASSTTGSVFVYLGSPEAVAAEFSRSGAIVRRWPHQGAAP